MNARYREIIAEGARQNRASLEGIMQISIVGLTLLCLALAMYLSMPVEDKPTAPAAIIEHE